MVRVSEKKINGKKYLYAEHSFRLPDGGLKKASKKIDKKADKDKKEVRDFLFKREVEMYQKYALSKYGADFVLTTNQIKKLEEIRVGYKKIIKNLTKTQLKDLLDRFTINNTYETNAIEGNSLTLKDVTLVIEENRVPENKDLREVYETKNTREAHELMFQNKIKIKLEDIIKLHKIIMKNTGVVEGFKKVPNFLVMRNLETTAPENVENEMKKLIVWYENNKNKIHPLKLASEVHARFEEIHPFEDGNGRVGRILMNVILLNAGYPPLIIRKTGKIAYLEALRAFDNGHKRKLERFLLNKLKKTYKNFFAIYLEYLK